MKRLIPLLLAILALLCFPLSANGQNGPAVNSMTSPISDVETRGEPFLARVSGDPVNVGRFGTYAVFEVWVMRCIGQDCGKPIEAFTHIRRGESLKSGDEVVVWEFAKRGKDGAGNESGFVALKTNMSAARDLIMTIREKRGSIVPEKPKG